MKQLFTVLFLFGTLSVVYSSEEQSIVRLSQAIQFQTVARSDDKFKDEFLKFHQFLKKSFPLSFSKLEVVPLNQSFLLIWKGSENSKSGVLFNAHMDVVPVDSKDLSKWERPPFSGKVDEEFIWGRGTIDDKAALLALLESTENLLKNNFNPKSNIYFSFGQDEEIGGSLGAASISQWLVDHKYQVESVIDEGLIVIKDILMGFEKPVAMVGVAEKGYLTLKLRVFKSGGHSSMPEYHTSVNTLIEALSKLHLDLFDRKITAPMKVFFEKLGNNTGGLLGFALRNPELLGPFIVYKLSQNAASNALLQTTLAITILAAGEKENVIPNFSEATINFRILPGEDKDFVINKVKETINNPAIEIIEVEKQHTSNPSPIASFESKTYKLIESSLESVYPEAVVAPSLMVAKTDSFHYQNLTSDIYRLLPMKLNKEDTHRIHGINERISKVNYLNMIRFYSEIFKSL
ncbi:MAG: M20/M25/M40 family metallo-hydrolase [Halobacteriovoraceae bacterium]|nr:M20/M25/M40 family metallo-hydrolase [Halobacteriovoraceae bacterium]